jgi:ribosomal-protein-alanine N-acetyltransferase
MIFKVPSDEKLLIKSERLTLEPILTSHAEEMVELLSDPELYTFVPQEPPELNKLIKTYDFWSKRISPEGNEIWLNWAARLTETGVVIGHFQAGIKEGTESNLGYTVGKQYQRNGFASEALRAILSFLNGEMDLKSIKAWIDTRNIASVKLVEKLGMTQIGVIKKADHFKGVDSDEFVYQFNFFNF